MAKIAGIGGAFIDSNDPKRLAQWYETVLGLKLQPHNDGFYQVFPVRDADSGILRENPVFAINPAAEPLAPPDRRGFMLNLRVDNLDAFLAQLAEHGVVQAREKVVWERGKHAWIRDIDGNRLELYEEVMPEGSG